MRIARFRVIEVFAEGLDLAELRFSGVGPEVTAGPSAMWG